jgi:hypothetical protein
MHFLLAHMRLSNQQSWATTSEAGLLRPAPAEMLRRVSAGFVVLSALFDPGANTGRAELEGHRSTLRQVPAPDPVALDFVQIKLDRCGPRHCPCLPAYVLVASFTLYRHWLWCRRRLRSAFADVVCVTGQGPTSYVQ